MFKKIKGIHINGRKEMSITEPIQDFLTPKMVYLPINSGNITYKPLVEVGEYVLKGQLILERVGRFSHPVACPVSGFIKSVKKMWHPSGKMLEMLEIENDFQEKAVESFGVENTLPLTKELIIEKVQQAGIVGLGGAGFPTFVKYSLDIEMEAVLINAAECEPYLTADYMSIKENTSKLIRGIEYIIKATNAKQAIIAIKKTKKPAIEILEKATKDKSNITVGLLNDVYPAGWEKYIVEHIMNKTYDALPSDCLCVVNNVQTAISVCDAVEKNIPLIEKVFTLTGECINKPRNYRVKIGTLVSDLINLSGGYVEGLDEAYLIAGGPMTGKSIMFDDLVITASLGSVIVMPKQIKIDNPACLGCGKCAEICPTNLTPTEIKKAHALGDIETLKLLNTMKCVQCGLCSYVCPSRIEMTEAVGKAKEALMKAR